MTLDDAYQDDALTLAREGLWIFGNKKTWQSVLAEYAFGC